MANELKPCPFCKGEAETHFQPLYTEDGVCIRCTNCGARSRFLVFDCVYEQYHGEAKVYIPKERAIKDVIDLWNRRATDGK